MAARILKTSTTNAFSTTLNGSIDSSVTTITLTSITGLQATGVVVLDRQDGAGNDTPTKREYISFTGISGNDLTGVTRGVAGSTAQSHSSGALVEEVMSVTHWNDLYDYLTAEHTLAGLHIISTATITTHLMASGASVVMTDVTVQRRLALLSGASLTGNLPLNPTWVMPGVASAATISIGKPLTLPWAGHAQYVSITLRSPVSSASLIFDVNRNFTSIFDAGTRPFILGGGTYVSTASLATKNLSQGDTLSVDLDAGGEYSDATLTLSLR